LTIMELVVVWITAFGCIAAAAGALHELGTTRPGIGIAVLCAGFACGLVRRALAAVMIGVLVAAVGVFVGFVLIVDGAVRDGFLAFSSAGLLFVVLGRAVVRELDRST